MLDFRMNTFLTVCRCMNFTRASEELHITQPAVSQHIRYLEKHYGQKLFCYEGKRLGLTSAGEMLKNASLTMLHDEISLQNRMHQNPELPGELRFGVSVSLGEDWVIDTLKEYLKQDKLSDKQNSVFLKVETGSEDELLRKLDAGEIEFALTEGVFSKRKYESCIYENVRLMAVCSPDFAFPTKQGKVADITEHRILLPGQETKLRMVLESEMAKSGIHVKDFPKVGEIGSLHMMKELTKAGCGITFLYETAIWNELNRGELREIKLKDFRVSQSFSFVWKKGSPSAVQYQELFEQYRKK